MRRLLLNKITAVICSLAIVLFAGNALAEIVENETATIDRIQVVEQQIQLLKSRLKQWQQELTGLQKAHDKELSEMSVNKINKNTLDKIALEISVAKSNLDSASIELTDTQQTINWLEKNNQEIQNQLNVLNIFGLKVGAGEVANISEMRGDLAYQQQLLQLEKKRATYLQEVESTASNILQFRKEMYARINAQLKSSKLMMVKQQQIKDELLFQEQQNHWLQQLNLAYAKLSHLDPVKSKEAYSSAERDIFYANESASFAYFQSLIARYKDQIQQMKIAVLRSNSISLLNEVSDQVLILNKQIERLNTVIKARMAVLDKHISYLSQKKKDVPAIHAYLQRLGGLRSRYQQSDEVLLGLNNSLIEFRKTVDKALQDELSSRQGFPTFSLKTFFDIGKECLLIPALTFQVVKSLSTNLLKSFTSTSLLSWSIFGVIQIFFIFAFFSLYKWLTHLVGKPSAWREKINTKWLSLQCLRRNFVDVAIVGNVLMVLYYFNVPSQNYLFLIYLAGVWLAFKTIMTLSRLCLVETTHNTAGHDVKLYYRLKWIILIGGVVTAITVFVHQLPLVYELKTLCDRLFLFVLMIISLLMLRSWDVVPQLILSHMESRHPYLQRSVRFIGILIPILMVGNSIIGLLGFVNLIMTVSWYEGVFLVVLIAYLILRGLLSDGMEQLSRIVIMYVNNGWLWTEAFLKPLDKVLRITLFLSAWAVLFLLYGWDQQSPIVERLTRLLHYQLANVLKTTITPISIIELFVVISIFYWTAKWTREFVYRLLFSRTEDMGIRNTIAILSQYSVIALGAFICMRVLGIDLSALVAVAGLFAFGVGLGLRDLANNFACGFLILLERPLRVGDIVNVGGTEGEVLHIGGRAVTIKTWDHMELVVPNTEIFNKSFTNWTARDNIVRSVSHIKISRYDNPHEVKTIIQNVLAADNDVLKDPVPEVYMKEIDDTLMDFEIRYFVNIRRVKSRTHVMSHVLMNIWDAFAQYGIKPPHPQQEVILRNELPKVSYQGSLDQQLNLSTIKNN
jgi:potassium-dependent mechanosensitive channel